MEPLWGHENVLYLDAGGSYTDVLVFQGCHRCGGLNTEMCSLSLAEALDGGISEQVCFSQSG